MVRPISASELDIDLFYHHFPKPKGYIFPVQLGKVRPPPESSWSSQLITSTKIEQFYDQRPWDLYDQTIHPISFKPSGWFEKLVEAYEGFVDSHRQALWESTHCLWISDEQRKTDPGLAAFARARRQRRSRAGPRWKRVLQLILQGMIDGLCDLDILLDPIFLHFPRPNEARVWYPGLSVRRTNIPN